MAGWVDGSIQAVLWVGGWVGGLVCGWVGWMRKETLRGWEGKGREEKTRRGRGCEAQGMENRREEKGQRQARGRLVLR